MNEAADVPDDRVTFEVHRSGTNGTVCLTARHRGEALFVDKLDLMKAKDRACFLESLLERCPALDRSVAEVELLALAESAASRPAPPVSPPGEDVELDVSRIVRPDLFFTAEACGLSVPYMTETAAGPGGRWAMYLRRADGTRERRLLAPALDLPDDGRLWFSPSPGPPMTADLEPLARWSKPARDAWLEGAAPPDPTDLYCRLRDRIADYIDFPADVRPAATATLALWTMLTYCFPCFPAVPYLYIGGPQNSGKSRTFDVLGRLVYRPLSSSNLTAPALFRTLNQQGGTLLLDEAERLRDTKSPDVAELRSLLLAGYRRGGRANRLEPVGDTFRTVAFDVFGPKALACITGLPPALASRCITFRMTRAAAGSEQARRPIDVDPDGWPLLRDELHAFALCFGADLLAAAAERAGCAGLSNRDAELWQPLMTIARLADPAGSIGLAALIEDFAGRLADESREDATPEADALLLSALAALIAAGIAPTAGDVLARARDADAELFRTWAERGVSAALARYSIRTKKSHGRRVYRGLTLDAVRDIAERYSIDLDE